MPKFFSLDKASLADKVSQITQYSFSDVDDVSLFAVEVGHGFSLNVSVQATPRMPWHDCDGFGVIEQRGDEDEDDQVIAIDSYTQYNVTKSIDLAKEQDWVIRNAEMSDADYNKAIADSVDKDARFVVDFVEEDHILAEVSCTISHPSLGVIYDDVGVSEVIVGGNKGGDIIEAAENFIIGANKWYDNEGKSLIAESVKKHMDDLAKRMDELADLAA